MNGIVNHNTITTGTPAPAPMTVQTLLTPQNVEPQNVMLAGQQTAHNTMMDRRATRAEVAAAKRTWSRPRVEQTPKPPKLTRPKKVRKTRPPQAPFGQLPGQAAAPATPVTLGAVAALLLEGE